MGDSIKFSKLLRNEEKADFKDEHPLEITGEESPAGGTAPVAGTDEAEDVGVLVEETTGNNPDNKVIPPPVGLGEEINKDEEAIRES